MSFAQWINDMRWAMNAKRARAWRRKLMFSQREAFDRALRPRLGMREPGVVIDYPDAFYHIDIEDLCRAMDASVSRPQRAATTDSKPQKVCLYSDGCPMDGPVCHLCAHVQPGGGAAK